MIAVKKHGRYFLIFNSNTKIELTRSSDFRINDVLKFGDGYWQISKVYDSHNSNTPDGEAHYDLEPISEEKLIEQAYNLTKF